MGFINWLKGVINKMFATEAEKADKDENRNIAGSETTEYLHCLIKGFSE